MTIDEFKKKFSKEKQFDRFTNYALCILSIFGGIYFFYEYVNSSIRLHIIASFALIFIGVYGLTVLKNLYKITILENQFSKKQNSDLISSVIDQSEKVNIKQQLDYVHFIYRKNWWKMPYEIYLFADNNIIALHVEAQDYKGGFIDFGGAKRCERQIIKLITEKYTRLK